MLNPFELGKNVVTRPDRCGDFCLASEALSNFSQNDSIVVGQSSRLRAATNRHRCQRPSIQNFYLTQTCFTLWMATSPTTSLLARKLPNYSDKRCHNSSDREHQFHRLTTLIFGDLHPVGCPIGQAIAAAGVIE